MAVSHAFIQLVLALALIPAIATAKNFIVGDGAGWRTRFDYTNWAKGKDFRVGDTLQFNYPAGSHDVYKVGQQADFVNCQIPLGGVPFTSGDDRITLQSSGKKWYICGVPGHCAAGQKLSITVQEAEAPAPAPAPIPATED